MIDVQARLDAEAKGARMLLTVHDELVLEAAESEAERVGAMVRETMERAWPHRPGLVVDVGIGRSWADC